tara:strand:+ start:26 stop:256 length:231 start_codon:yes stop_codon:yes gene_type:complete
MKGNKQMKTQKKTSVKRVEIKLHSLNWENQLPLYLDLYSKLSEKGKKEMKDQLKHLGKLVDIYQKEKTEKERKEIK